MTIEYNGHKLSYIDKYSLNLPNGFTILKNNDYYQCKKCKIIVYKSSCQYFLSTICLMFDEPELDTITCDEFIMRSVL